MPPRRAAAAKSAAATKKPASKSANGAKAKPKPKAKTGGKRARDEVSDVEDDDEPEDVANAKDAPAPAKKAKRGIAPVDKFSGMDRTHKVYVDKQGEIYDATLNQTNIGKNNNKFYVLQLLYPVKSSATAVLFTRWGRVGENGNSQTKGPWPAEVAVEEFKEQFKKKAGIKFEDRYTAAPKAGKYVHIEMQYDDEEGEEDKAAGDGKSKPREKTPDSALDKPVKDLVDFIFDPKYIQNHLGFFHYDANKLPLGKLSKETVANGYSVLKEISEALSSSNGAPDASTTSGSRKPRSTTAKNNTGKIFEELTNRYYSIIPHAFGRAKPTVINTQDLLKQEVDLVGTLAELEETADISGGRAEKKEHPSDANLHSLDLEEIAVVDKESDEFKSLMAYCHETYAYGNHGQKMSIENMFRIERRGERQRWVEGGWDDLPDVDGSSSRLLLFHGSRSSNFGGILKNGLKIAPPEAPHNGYLYGKGLYFADMLKLSAGYTYSQLSDDTGLVLLCEVAAKPYLHRIQDTQYAAEECKKAKKTLFKTEATDHANWVDAGDATGNEKIKGVLMPDVSEIQERAKNEPWWADNMFVAYDVSQVRIRYLVRMKFGK